jgi:hypothetical protein
MLPALASKFPARGAVLVRSVGDQRDVFGALVDELDRDGHDVRVDGSYPNETEYGRQRTSTTKDVDQVWIVAQTGWLVSRLMDRKGATLVASYSPLHAKDEATLAALQNTAAEALQRDPNLLPDLDSTHISPSVARRANIDASDVRQLERYNRRVDAGRGRRTVVVAVSPEDADDLAAAVLPSGENPAGR